MRFYRWFVLPILLASAGCQHALEWRALDARGRYERSVSDARAFALESGGRRRVLIESAESHEGLGGQTFLMYLSFKFNPGGGIDLSHPKVFVSISDVAVSFNGFLTTEALDAHGDRVSGRFAGKVRGEGQARDEVRNIDVTLDSASVAKVESRAELDRKGYSQAIRDRLYRLEFDAADREYWRAPDAPVAKNSPKDTDISTHEHH